MTISEQQPNPRDHVRRESDGGYADPQARRAVASLQDQAVAADAASSMEISLALLWKELTRGVCRVVQSFFTEQRCFVVVAASDPSSAASLTGRRLAILESVLCGVGQKRVAIDLCLAPSTVALNARLALASLGVEGKPSRVHPLLMLAAKAACDQDVAFTGGLSFTNYDGLDLRVIAVPRPDRRLADVLPPAELAVVRSLVEGTSYQEIAHARGTSTRTIANQITAVFRRMRVSGRNELLLRLFFTEGLGRGVLPFSPNETLLPPASQDIPRMSARRSA